MTKFKFIIILSVIFAVLLGFLGGLLLMRNSVPTPPLDIQANTNINSNHLSQVKIENPDLRKGETDPKLQFQTNSLLPLFNNMPLVPTFITDEPIIKSGSETQKGVAYTTCVNKDNPTIYLKKVFYQKANQKQLTNILKHELVHAWFCRQGIQTGHDERFRRKFKEVGGFGN